MTSPVARSSPWGRSKSWSPIKHSSMDQHQSDPGSPWLINTWLLLITSVHMHSRSSMRKKTKKNREKKGCLWFTNRCRTSALSLEHQPACEGKCRNRCYPPSAEQHTKFGERDFSAKCWRPLMLMTCPVQHKMCFQKLKTQIRVVFVTCA